MFYNKKNLMTIEILKLVLDAVITLRDTMNFITLLVLCVAINVAPSLNIKKKLKGKAEKIKNKLKNLTHNKKGEELFLVINEFEYPGSNETLREMHREQWLEYYECLKENYARSGAEKIIYPIALMALEGTTVALDCEVCTSPAETNLIELVEWYYNSSVNNSVFNEPVELTEHTLISPEDKSLLIYNIQSNQAGQYWCKLGDTLAAPYFIHIDNGSEPTEMVRPDEAPLATHASPPTIISRYNLKVYSSWTEWTECSACDRVGKKMRYGYCTISILDSNKNDKHSSSRKDEIVSKTNSESNNSRMNKREGTDDALEPKEDSKEILDLVKNILPVFRNKMPCRSEQTPKKIKDIEEIRNRKTEIMIRFCKMKCQKNVIFEVRDESGKVLESANNSAGIYSMHQGIPEAPPSVTRITIYEKHGTKTTLKCPGNLNTDAPIVWQIRDKLIYPKLIAEQSKNRIYTDMKNELTITELRFADENIYSCWQNGELAGTVRLQITEEVDIKFDHHVFMFGAIIIVSVFLYVFWRAFRGRKRISTH